MHRFNSTPTYTIILDRTSPGVILSTPLNNTNTTDPSQNLTVNITDNVSGIKNASLYIFNSSNILINQTNRTITGLDVTLGIIYNFLYDGIFKWFYRVTDYSNNINTTVNYTLTLDRVNPRLNITYPINNTNYVINISTMNYTYNDSTGGLCFYSLDQGLTNSTTFVLPGNNFTNLISIEGVNNWTVYCNDSANNWNNSLVIFFKDTIKPQLSIIEPFNNTNYSVNISTLNYSYT